MRSPGRWVNVALLTLFVITTLSGGLAFGIGDPAAARVVTAVHGAAGLGLLLLVPAKSRLVRRGLRRPGRSRKVISAVLVLAVLLTVAAGLLHVLGGWRHYLGLLPIQLHVGSALVAVALLTGHAVAHRRHPYGVPGRPVPVRGPPRSRRAVLATALVAGSVLLWLAVPGRDRRETGSHEVGSGDPARMPVTQWLFDPIPSLDTLRLRVPDRLLDAAALAALPQHTVRAVIDCTVGWWSEQEWRGVPLSALGLPAGAAVDVVSVTGYRRRLPAVEADRLLLATHAGGRPLTAGHGGPLRLVAPGRRGFWWVKWVVAVEVADEPWWWQPPFPLQ